jgi:hypothetical protein
MRQLDTLGGEFIGALGIGASKYPAAVATQLAHAKIIDVEEEDVWSLRRH